MTRQELAAAYLALVGHDPIADDPSMATDDLRELLTQVQALRNSTKD